jgi:hypothetical protein
MLTCNPDTIFAFGKTVVRFCATASIVNPTLAIECLEHIFANEVFVWHMICFEPIKLVVSTMNILGVQCHYEQHEWLCRSSTSSNATPPLANEMIASILRSIDQTLAKDSDLFDLDRRLPTFLPAVWKHLWTMITVRGCSGQLTGAQGSAIDQHLMQQLNQSHDDLCFPPCLQCDNQLSVALMMAGWGESSSSIALLMLRQMPQYLQNQRSLQAILVLVEACNDAELLWGFMSDISRVCAAPFPPLCTLDALMVISTRWYAVTTWATQNRHGGGTTRKLPFDPVVVFGEYAEIIPRSVRHSLIHQISGSTQEYTKNNNNNSLHTAEPVISQAKTLVPDCDTNICQFLLHRNLDNPTVSRRVTQALNELFAQ